MKKARTFFENRKIDFEFIDFKKLPPSLADIERWSIAFHGLPVNLKGTTYKKLKDEFESLSPKDKVKFVAKNPSMIKRPILERHNIVLAFGFSESEYEKVLM